MSFLYPAFLFGLGALAIPVIVHLFQFRKIKKVYFSSTKFLREVNEQTSQKRRLKHYLILACRLLFIVFLVLAFAQPYIPASEQFDADAKVYLYIDNSFSMMRPAENDEDALDAAIAIARELVQQLPVQTSYKVIDNDFSPSSYTFKNRTEVLDLLTERKFSASSRSFSEIARRIRSDEDIRRKEIFYISDFQASTLGDISSIKTDSLESWQFIKVATETVSNVFIDSVFLENPLSIPGEPNTIRAIIRNTGQRKAEAVLIKLIINNIQAATNTISIAPDEKPEIGFDLSGEQTQGGTYKAEININDFPISFDNAFYFILDFKQRLNVLELYEPGAPNYISKVYGNELLFNLERVSIANVDYNRILQADLVVLNSPVSISTNLIHAVQSFVDEGGSVLVIPAIKPDLSSYQSLLRQPQLNLLDSVSLIELEAPDLSNPFFDGIFEEKSPAMLMPKARRLLSWGADRTALLKTKDGQAFLTTMGRTGTLMVLSSPLDKQYTDFYNHALFVPVMYRIAASGKKGFSKPYHRVNEGIVELRLDSIYGDEPLKLVGAQEIIPSQRKLNNRVILETPPYLLEPGFYELKLRDQAKAVLAFNPGSAESELGIMPLESLQNMFGKLGNIRISESASAEAFSNEIKERYLGKALWKTMLILALLFLLFEVLVIRYIK